MSLKNRQKIADVKYGVTEGEEEKLQTRLRLVVNNALFSHLYVIQDLLESDEPLNSEMLSTWEKFKKDSEEANNLFKKLLALRG